MELQLRDVCVKQSRKKTYSAAVARGDQAGVVVEVAGTVVAAVVAKVVTDKLDLEVEVGAGGGLVLEHGQPGGAGRVADTKVHGGPVADGLGAVTPLAALLVGDTLVVDVVLSGGGLTLPLEVGVAVGAGQGMGLTSKSVERNGLGLGTGVVGTANGDLVAELVADVDTASAGNAESVVGRVGEVELAVLALQTTNRLASSALSGGPLGLLVAGRAGVRAHSAASAGVASDGGHDRAHDLIGQGDVLDTGVTAETQVVEGDSTVLGGEGATVDLAVGELSIDTSAGAERARAVGTRASRGGGGGGRGRSAGGAGGDGSGGLNQDLGSDGGGRGSRRGARWSAGASAGRASVGDGVAEPFELVLGETSAGLLLAEAFRGTRLGVQHNEVIDGRTSGDSGLGLGLSGALVEVSMAVLVGGHQGARRGESHGNGVGELHCVSEFKLRVCRFERDYLSVMSGVQSFVLGNGIAGHVVVLSLIHVVLPCHRPFEAPIAPSHHRTRIRVYSSRREQYDESSPMLPSP